MRFVAPRSVVGARFPGSIGSLDPADARICLAVPDVADHRPLPLSRQVHSPASFTSTSEHDRLPPAPSSTLRSRGGAPPMGFSPSSRCHWRRPRLPELPRSGFGPSAAFLTPSTVSSAASSAGLFHPATTSRVRPSGVCPSHGAAPGFPGRCPPAVGRAPPPVARASVSRPRLQGLALRASAVSSGNGEIPDRSAPLVGLCLLRVFTPRTSRAISRPLRLRPSPG